MKDETKLWLKYADENFKSSKILLESFLFNPSLQNTQHFEGLKFYLFNRSEAEIKGYDDFEKNIKEDKKR